jgi:hypothetical protein
MCLTSSVEQSATLMPTRLSTGADCQRSEHGREDDQEEEEHHAGTAAVYAGSVIPSFGTDDDNEVHCWRREDSSLAQECAYLCASDMGIRLSTSALRGYVHLCQPVHSCGRLVFRWSGPGPVRDQVFGVVLQRSGPRSGSQ